MNDNLNGSQFIYQTGLKNKPNAQGTLFRAKPEARTPASRQPRGYSPERYRQVTEALDVKRRTGEQRQRLGRVFNPDNPHPHGGADFGVYHEHADAMARAVASIARSTVPMSDITPPHRSLPLSADNPRLSLGITNKTSQEAGELGHYSKPGWAGQPGLAHITLTKDAHGQDTTPIHEIGHHVDRAQPYTTSSEMGRAEGFADAYAQTHARTAGYKQKRIEIPSHPEKWGETLKSASDARGYNYGASTNFTNAYKGQHTPLNHKQFDPYAPPEGQEKTFPSHHVKGQLALMQKSYGDLGRGYAPAWHYADWVKK